MALRVNTNLGALQAQRALSLVSSKVDTNLQRLSSGLRVNSAADDAAGLAVSEQLGSAVRGFNQLIRNANDGISLIQVGESALGEILNGLTRLRELALQSANGTLSDTDRNAIHQEFSALTAELDRIAKTTEFSSTYPINGSSSLHLQVGLNSGGNNVIVLNSVNASVSALGISGLSVSRTTPPRSPGSATWTWRARRASSPRTRSSSRRRWRRWRRRTPPGSSRSSS